MKMDAVNIVIIENSIPDVALTLIAKDEDDRVRVGNEAEEYFRTEMKHNGYSDEAIEEALEDGHTSNGDWDIWISWTIVDVPIIMPMAK